MAQAGRGRSSSEALEDEQQELLGVESAEAVVETAKDVVLAVAAVLGMRASWFPKFGLTLS